MKDFFYKRIIEMSKELNKEQIRLVYFFILNLLK